MNNATLSTTISKYGGRSASYWLRLEQQTQPVDTVSLEQIADIADGIFSVSPCTDPDSYLGGDDRDPIPTLADVIAKAREVVAITASVVGLAECGAPDLNGFLNTANGDWEAKVRVYRSHVCEEIRPPGVKQYPVAATGGDVSSPMRIVEEIDVVINVNADQVTLDRPLSMDCFGTAAPGDYTFETQSPVDGVSGSTIYFSERVGVFRLSYTTEYDLYTVTVKGKNGVAQGCTFFCTYKGLAATLELTSPSLDDNGAIKCLTASLISDGDAGGTAGTSTGSLPAWDGKSPKCYQTTKHTVKCSCTNKKHDEYETESDVNCPDTETEGAHQVGDTLNSLHYTYCGTIDDVHDPDFYKDNCCFPPSFPLPECKKRYSIWNGGAGDSSKLDKYRKQDNVSLIPVSPKDGFCGIQTIEQVVHPLSCCDEIVTMEADPANPGGLVVGTTDQFCVLHGNSHKKWTASRGLTFANRLQSMETDGGCVFVTMDGDACENGQVRVSDGCSEINIPVPRIDFEKLKLAIAAYEASSAVINVTGTISPKHLVINAEFATFEGGATEIDINSGSVTVIIPIEQQCVGNFTVRGSNDCGETAIVTIPVENQDLGGLVCFPYYAYYSSFLDWCATGPAVSDVVPYYSGGSFSGVPNTVNAGFCGQPAGTYNVMVGQNPYRAVIGSPYKNASGNDLVDIVLTPYQGIAAGNNLCATCKDM